MRSEITEEKDDENPCKELQKERIRRIVEHQKSLYWSSSSSSSLCSSSASSCSSSCRERNSLLELMRGGSTSLRRLFDMEHTSLANHFQDYSGSPVTKPILLWGSDTDDDDDHHHHRVHDAWASIKQSGPFRDTSKDQESNQASDGDSMIDLDFRQKKRNQKAVTRRLTRKRSFRRLPGSWRCRLFRFRRLRILICGRIFR